MKLETIMRLMILICTMFVCTALVGGMKEWTEMMTLDGNILMMIMFVYGIWLDIKEATK